MTGWDDLPLAEHHVAKLVESGITPETARAFGIHSITSVDQLPEGFEFRGEAAVPAIAFVWKDAETGQDRIQLRVDRPEDNLDRDGKECRYLWRVGYDVLLGERRRTDEPGTVLIVEGTKQSIVAAAYAGEGTAVYGIAGCRTWQRDGVPTAALEVCDSANVIVVLDSDAADNPEVYEAGMKLAEAIRAEGAKSVRFARVPGGKKSGLDDYLGGRRPERRELCLAKLIEGAKTKPADQKPTARKKAAVRPAAMPSPDGRPQIVINNERLQVINDLTAALLDRWNTVRLFNHGNAIGQFVASRCQMSTVGEGALQDIIQQTAITVRRAKGDDEDAIEYAWPEAQAVKALMSRHEYFAKLDRITQAPFVRKDGTICQVNGYDELTETLVVMDDALTGIDVPSSPTASEVALALKLIMEEWLGDFPFFTDADRANALALVVTPFVRGQMPVVPLAVIDGLQMGVGKNLFADCFHTLVIGGASEPLPWPREDDEVRKVITSAFRTGASLFVFDEAHHLDGAALAQALTAHTWKDRQLGVSQMLSFPNRVTWVSLGNAVRIEGDITRRVYRVALRPATPNPQDRPTSSFRHPDLLEWTRENRPRLLTAVLTLVRAWFAAGQPKPSSRVSSFGSFEAWERIVGGIVEHAGQGGFLANLQEWRSETSYTAGFWSAHIHWLRDKFGDEAFTVADAYAAMRNDPNRESPPDMTDLLTDPDKYKRMLGVQYFKHRDRYYDGLRLTREDHGAQRKVAKWRVGVDGDGSVTVATLTDPSGGSGGSGGTPTPTHHAEKTCFPDAPSDADTHVSAHIRGSDAPSAPSAPSGDQKPLVSSTEGDITGQSTYTQSDITDVLPATAAESVDLHTYVRSSAVTLPEGVVSFDIETDDSDKLWHRSKEFIRLNGYQVGAEIRATADASEMAELIRSARVVVGHNIMNFDLVAFALHHGIDLHDLAAQGRVIDTMLSSVLAYPPGSGVDQGRIKKEFSLDQLGRKFFDSAKTGDLKALAKEFEGFDGVPVNDARYVEYCAGDVELTSRLAMRLRDEPGAINDYTRREHRIAAIAAQIRMNGFRVDLGVLAERLHAGRERRKQLVDTLVNRYGLPLVDAKGKAYAAPHQSKLGKAAIDKAFADLGVTLARTPKSGDPALGKEEMEKLREVYGERPDVLDLLDTIGELNGIRTVYETVERCRLGDRVHPDIAMFQSSGRWSITEPGLTVMGKRGGKHIEREMFLPETGHVIVAADLSQVDARAVAAHCQDPAYLALFEDGRDSHKEIALAVWGDAGRRDDAKVIGHGWNYGMGLANLARKCGSHEAAREFDAAMRERFPGLVEWKRDVAARADAGELLDNGFGRKLRCAPGAGWTQAPALMGQSAARDIMMEGLLRMPREMYPYLRAVVHDEIVMSIPEDRADEIEAQVLEALSFPWSPHGPDSRHVQIEAGFARRGKSWGAVYEK